MRVASRAVALLLNSLLAGCITAPKVAPVEKPVETRPTLGLGAAAAPVQDNWWAAYQDPQLDQLLAAALADNPTLAQTLARLRQAQAVVYATRATLWPYVSYDASEVRERVSKCQHRKWLFEDHWCSVGSHRERIVFFKFYRIFANRRYLNRTYEISMLNALDYVVLDTSYPTSGTRSNITYITAPLYDITEEMVSIVSTIRCKIANQLLLI